MAKKKPASGSDLAHPKGSARRGFLRDAALDAGDFAADMLAKRIARFEEAMGTAPRDEAVEEIEYDYPIGMELYDRPYFRPPGAIPEVEFLETCERCRVCVDVCPEMVITPAQKHMGAPEGTPILFPNDAPCTLCGDCMDACPSGALMPTPPEFVRIGEAYIVEQTCLAWGEEGCTKCYDACPVTPNAIWFPEDKHGTTPVVEEQHCTGCGLCVPVCPTSPRKSIEVRLKPIENEEEDDELA